MSGFNRAKKQGQDAWGQVQGASHSAGDMLQGMRFGGNSPGMGAINKGGNDFMAEMNRAYQNPERTAVTLGGAFLAPATGGMSMLPAVRRGGGMSNVRHNWGMQLDSTYAKNYRQDEARAEREANNQALLTRQRMNYGGVGGGGAGVAAEIEAYNAILAHFAQQQQGLRGQNAQADMQTIGSIMQLLAMFGKGPG